MMSLWPVSDAGTQELMIAYYQALQAAGQVRRYAGDSDACEHRPAASFLLGQFYSIW